MAQAKSRGLADRLRYSISFEFTLVLLITPAGMFVFDGHFVEIGALAVLLSFHALLTNLVYNYIFDRIEARTGRVSSDRGFWGRVLHAVGFEGVLVLTGVPILMFWLHIGFWEAAATEFTLMILVAIYTFFFTLAYDRMFPVT